MDANTFRCLICGAVSPTFVGCADHVLDAHSGVIERVPAPAVDPDYYVDPRPSEGPHGR